MPPRAISPEVLPDRMVFAVNTIGVPASPKVMVVFVVWTVPARFTWLGAVAVTPPVKVVVSPVPLPKVTAPELLKVAALVMVEVVPLKTTL